MQLAMIGLGRMGGNMVRRLLQGGHEVVVFDRSADGREVRTSRSAPQAARDLADLCGQLARRASSGSWCPPGSRWRHDRRAAPGLSKGDIIIDGGNSNFKDTMRARRPARRSRGSSSSTPAPAAASGGSRTATA